MQRAAPAMRHAGREREAAASRLPRTVMEKDAGGHGVIAPPLPEVAGREAGLRCWRTGVVPVGGAATTQAVAMFVGSTLDQVRCRRGPACVCVRA
eukprot:SAG25_NODE_129_length_14495_cov_41.326202_1_plen_95_part_00